MFGKNKKRSIIERLTGTIHVDDYDDDLDYEEENNSFSKNENTDEHLNEIETRDGELAVDVFNTEDAIIIKAMIAGVRPSDMDVDIARDMVTIRGTREEEQEVQDHDYYHRELYWGSFSRNILLPEEVDVEAAEATEKNGLLTIFLPKIDKHKKTKLQIKSR